MKKLIHLLLVSALLTGVTPSTQAGSQPFIGEVQWFAGNFAPRGWAFCNGQLLPIGSNDALFSILGTTYGGDGETTFALPDVRGRVLVHAGNAPGLTPRTLGSRGGTESESLSVNQIPSHTHNLQASGGPANSTAPTNNVLASPGRTRIYDSGTPNATMSNSSIRPTGGSQAHNNMQPFVTLNCIIALTGVFPSQF